MKTQIRRGVFETNSSSVHVIAIAKNSSTTPKNNYYFSAGEFGWYGDGYIENYLYTAIIEKIKCKKGWNISSEDLLRELEPYKKAIRDAVPESSFDFDDDNNNNCYIDHQSYDTANSLLDFIFNITDDEITADRENLLMALNGSDVWIGNDNDDMNYPKFSSKSYIVI